MKNTTTNPYSTHQEVILLLPWYVNKTLSSQETATVEAHVKLCLVCKREMINLQNLAQVVKQPGSLDSAQSAGFMRLKQRLHAKDALSVTPTLNNSPTVNTERKPLSPSLRFSRPLLALAASLLLITILPGILQMPHSMRNDYRTLSSTKQSTMSHNEIYLTFVEAMTSKQIEQFVSHYSGQIVNGPDQHTGYTVRFENVQNSSELLDLLLQLKNNPKISAAEPA